jgi:hypothetical protein
MRRVKVSYAPRTLCTPGVVLGIDGAAALALYSKMKRVCRPQGSYLFKQGAECGDGMLIIVKGVVGCYAEDDMTLMSRAVKTTKSMPFGPGGAIVATQDWPPQISAPPSPISASRTGVLPA